MKIHKLGALSGVTALFGAAAVAVVAPLAMAAPLTVTISDAQLLPKESATVTIAGCPAGGTVSFPKGVPTVFQSKPSDGKSVEYTFTYADVEPGKHQMTVTCTPPKDSTESPSTAIVSFAAFGNEFAEAKPEQFKAGDVVSITAGDFVPGSTVSMNVFTKGADPATATAAHRQEVGKAADDFSVSGDVVFPADLKCGEYDVYLTGDRAGLKAMKPSQLYICGKPTPSPSASPSVEPSSPMTPGKPGLPKTGN